MAPGAASAAPPVWTVRGPKGVVTLFGSVHMLPPGLDWRTPALDAALADADSLWFETPLDEATEAAAARLTARRARLPAGDTLWAHLSAGQRDRVEQAARALGARAESLTPLRPWMADLMLSLADAQRIGATASQGVEASLKTDAPTETRRMALETIGRQIDVLTGGSLAEQAASLDETAREAVEDPGLYERTVREWMAGDLAGLERDNLAPLRRVDPAAWRRLIQDRNRRWAVRLDRLARTPGHALVVVGVGHLIGPEGVPTLLRARGLTVEGPELPPVDKSRAAPD